MTSSLERYEENETEKLNSAQIVLMLNLIRLKLLVFYFESYK